MILFMKFHVMHHKIGLDICQRPIPPLELKILAVLRVLGRGYCFDGIEELCDIGEETIRKFFHKFNRLFSKELFGVYCSPPTSVDEIKATTSVYAKLGLPGCLGSADCVHVRWDRCPASEFNSHKGKEGYPTLSYEVTVDHCKRIIASTEGHKGTRNDKTIVRYDGFITDIHEGISYSKDKFTVMDESGNLVEMEGLYLIVDGGYHKWRCLQCPYKHSSEVEKAAWSE